MTTEILQSTNNQPEFEELPELPDIEAVSNVSTVQAKIPHTNFEVNNYLIFGGIGLILLILAAILIFVLIKKHNNNYSSNTKIDDDETNQYKSLGTSDTVKKCIRLFLENTRIK